METPDNHDYKHIVILGAGISGLTAAYELSKLYNSKVIVIEKEPFPGGLAATLHFDTINVDIGSHRIQSTVQRSIRSYISNTLGVNLLKQRRHGLLCMPGMSVSYPPNLLNLFRTLPLRMSLSYSFSLLERFRYPDDKTNYKSAMLHKVGKRIYENFFHEYIYKLWGIAPENISIEGMKRRKTILNLKSVLKSVAGKHRYFFYPENGIGAIADALAEKIRNNGGKIYYKSQLSNVETDISNTIRSVSVLDSLEKEVIFSNPLVLSTIPVDELCQTIFPYIPAPPLMWRDLRVVYIHISEQLHLRNETFYLPALDTACGRISFIQKYSPFLNTPCTGTIITCEFPTSQGDQIWEMDDNEIGRLCKENLIKCKILSNTQQIKTVYSVRIKKAYPVYTTTWKESYSSIQRNLSDIRNLFVFGRRGLFLHCNIDHAIRQGVEIAKVVSSNQKFKSQLWKKRADHFSTCSARD